jgi:DNA-binding NtrC family response regulator
MKRRSPVVKAKIKQVKNPDTPKKGDNEQDQLAEPLLVPPGLSGAAYDFEAHWAVSDKEPVLILGETGVGKSLFLHLAKQLFRLKHKNEKELPIVEANCGHFSGKHSDLNMTRSELFGHVQGSSSLAYKDKVGLVEKADGGLLILEEVGELPSEAQALLLTFIETGEYRRVGDEDSKKAKVKIVGATNREAVLRDDFRHRFFPFYIPPLRERKQDVLYYLNEKFPELVKTLNKSDVLILLSYHWPGNVREIERIGRLLLRRRWKPEGAETTWRPGQPGEYSDYGLYHLNQRDTAFDPDVLFALRNGLREFNADVDLLEGLLAPLRVSLDDQQPALAFEEFSAGSRVFCCFPNDRLRVSLCENLPMFTEAFEGYLTFCGLFLQEPAKNENVLASLRKCNIEHFSIERLGSLKSAQVKVHKLATAVMAYLRDFSAGDTKLPGEPREFWDTICRLMEESDTDGAYRKFENDEIIGLVCGMRERDLLKNYYLGLLKKTAGNVRMAAKNAGVLETTFRSKLDKLGIKYKRTDNSS